MLNTFLNGIPGSDKGAGVISTQFVSGRISAELAYHGGLTAVNYLGHQQLGHGKIFHGSVNSAFTKLMRLQIVIDGKVWYSEFNRTEYYPFGYSSECTLNQVSFKHQIILDNNVLYQRLLILDNPENHEIRARVLMTKPACNVVNSSSFSGWAIEPDGTMTGSYHVDDTDIAAALSANVPCKSYGKGLMYFMETKATGTEFIFALSFDGIPEISPDRLNRILTGYHSSLKQGPQFFTGSEILDSALDNAGPTLDALAVPGCNGAVRASQSYWVWGWDSMIHTDAYLWSGRAAVIPAMLDFYQKYADPEKGIGHAFTTDLKPYLTMRTCSQSIYVVLLHNYYAFTGDKETLKKYFPFAMKILHSADAVRSAGTNLGCGLAFFPDCPELLGQTRDGVSLINNSLHLQALKAAAALSDEMGLPGKAETMRHNAALLQKDMETYLWDESAGYWTDSAKGNPLTPNCACHPLYGQLYASCFAAEPGFEKKERIVRYLKEHFLLQHGLPMISPEDEYFMADGNQEGAYYPPMDRYCWNMLNAIGDADAMNDFIRIVSHFWEKHTYPEGLTHDEANQEPEVDNPGCKQAFTMKGWFCDALELNLGIKVYVDGFTLNPLPSPKRFEVRNLKIRGKDLNIIRTGFHQIFLNGNPVSGKITYGMLSGENLIEIK